MPRKAQEPKLSDHAKHPWQQRGACVYCVPCELRLYQGKLPKRVDKFAAAFDDIAQAAQRYMAAKSKADKKVAKKQADALARIRKRAERSTKT